MVSRKVPLFASEPAAGCACDPCKGKLMSAMAVNAASAVSRTVAIMAHLVSLRAFCEKERCALPLQRPNGALVPSAAGTVRPARGVRTVCSRHPLSWALARRRSVNALQFQTIGVGEKHGIVTLAVVVLRVIGRRIQDRGPDRTHDFIHAVDLRPAVDAPCQMMEARSVAVMLALRPLRARLDDADRMHAQFGDKVPIVAARAFALEPIAEGREDRVIKAEHLLWIAHR